MNNLNEKKNLLTEWLVGTVFASIAFDAGFSIRLERSSVSNDKPNVLILNIRSIARIGDENDWKRFIDSMPLKARRGEEDEPALAYRLMLLLGAEVKGIDLHDDGSISIVTTDGETIVISGVEDVWEESWVLEESKEVTKGAPRAVVCSSGGSIFLT